MAAAQKKDDASFEGVLEQLEGLVRQLESGNMALEDSLKAFEQGVGLSRKGAEMLDKAEARLEVLMQKGDGDEAVEVADLDEAAAAGASKPAPKRRSPAKAEPPSEEDLPF